MPFSFPYTLARTLLSLIIMLKRKPKLLLGILQLLLQHLELILQLFLEPLQVHLLSLGRDILGSLGLGLEVQSRR